MSSIANRARFGYIRQFSWLKSGVCKCQKKAMSSDSDYEGFLKTLTGGRVTVDKDEESGVAVVSIDNTSKRNAMSGSMMCDLKNIVSDLESWKTGKGVILKGEGGTFCSGGDIDTVKSTQTNELGHKMSNFMGNVMQRFSRLPLISVGLIEGNALGGGAELAVHCDFLVMSEKARLGFVQTKMGVITGWGGGTTLVRKVGPTCALDLLASARVLDAVECKRLGLVNEILPSSDNILDLTKSFLGQYCRGHVTVVRNLKSMIVAASTPLGDAVDMERRLFSELWGSEPNVEAFNKNIKH